MYTVSVIVPVYNAEKYIETCISSVLNNQYHRSSSSSQIYWALCGTSIHNRCIWFNGSVPLF